MPRTWVSDIHASQSVDEVFLVRRKTLLTSPTNGRPYLSVQLGDRTGELDARIWDQAERLSEVFDETDFVRVEGRVIQYQGRAQLHISTLSRVLDPQLVMEDFLPPAKVSVDGLFDQTLALLQTIAQPHLQRLVQQILADAPFMESYRRVPAGKSIHHAHLGGLMAHNLTLCRLVDACAAVYTATYPGLVDRDLLLTAAFLHDCGKTAELSTDRRFDYTDAGRLVGHVVLGFEFLSQHLARLPDFPADLALHLKHLLLSHHGELEFGASKRPKTIEAWILHFVDILDCRVDQTADLVASLPPGGWTPYQRLHDRYFWRGHQRGDAPADAPTDAPTDAPADAPADAPTGAPADASAADPAEPPAAAAEREPA